MKLASLIVSTFLIVAIKAAKHCDNLGTLFYDDLGCTPTLGTVGCPSSYDCPNFSVTPGVCKFRGKEYTGGQIINGTSRCNRGCYCQGASATQCAIVDCYFGPKDNEECYNTYTLHGCCASGEKCPPFNDLATCKANGKTYREGEKFVGDGTCMSCICGKGFKGELVEPFCERIKCDVELEGDKIADNCAPAYRKNKSALCCPSYYICQSKSTTEDVVLSGTKSDRKCKFGNAEYNLHDTLTLKYTYGGQHTAKCACNLPPLLTCTLDY
ncbi:PREDICTED: uncharacterized protein LOC108569220 [Nicrophorus vespilloides]|uniref:Uncharacterized protein LOC108569220 n=1 Tax=Nicrophorus vespilloides TaxID=110193 RepID=A0ABM1NH71_NICVS|nr:PREDICTED: uncharacterized protein LOC108569220 [Nicrophorus vespilloides]